MDSMVAHSLDSILTDNQIDTDSLNVLYQGDLELLSKSLFSMLQCIVNDEYDKPTVEAVARSMGFTPAEAILAKHYLIITNQIRENR